MTEEFLEPRRHEPPDGWTRETFEKVTNALARALVAAVRQHERRESEAIDQEQHEEVP